MNKIILATHGELSKGMLHSIKMIVGDLADSVDTFSLYPGESPSDYAKKMEICVNSSSDDFIFITDVKGGSVYNALLALTKYSNVKLFSGMNMPLVLEVILNKSENISLDLAKAYVKSASSGLTFSSKESLKQFHEENEDF